MKELPNIPSTQDLREIVTRAKCVGRRANAGKMAPTPKRLKRHHLKRTEHIAREILALTGEGACARLARDVIQLAHNIDSLAAEIFPVFDLVDKKIKEHGCTLTCTKEGYTLTSPKGVILSEGATLKEWLLQHVEQYGDQERFPYDPTSE